MAQVQWTQLDGDVWEGALTGTTWFKVSPQGYKDYYNVATRFPMPVNQVQSVHGSDEGKNQCQAAVDALAALLAALNE